MRAVICEDDKQWAEIIAAIICDDVDDIAIAHSLGECCEKLAAKKADILLLDLTLPDSSAANTLRAIKCLKRIGAKRVSVITAAPLDPDLTCRILECGADDMISKSCYSVRERLINAVNDMTMVRCEC